MYTVRRTIGRDVIAMSSNLEDALVFLNPSEEYPRGSLYIEDLRELGLVDEHITSYKGYALINEIYEDDEKFNKNCYMYGKEVGDGEYVYKAVELRGLSSGSYARWTEAVEVFREKIDSLQD